MHIRGIRGATTVEENSEPAVLDATRELLRRLAQDNNIEPDEIAAILFTCTPDLTAAFPAEAARQLQWTHVPLMSAMEIGVPDSVLMCIRVLILWHTARSQEEIVHVSLRGAAVARPDDSAGRGKLRNHDAAAGGDPGRAALPNRSDWRRVAPDPADGSHRGAAVADGRADCRVGRRAVPAPADYRRIPAGDHLHTAGRQRAGEVGGAARRAAGGGADDGRGVHADPGSHRTDAGGIRGAHPARRGPRKCHGGCLAGP